MPILATAATEIKSVKLSNPTLVDDSETSKYPYGLAQNSGTLYAGRMSKNDHPHMYAFVNKESESLPEIKDADGARLRGAYGVTPWFFDSVPCAVFRKYDKKNTSGGEPVHFAKLMNDGWVMTTVDLQDGTDRTPTLTVFNNKLFMFIKRADHKIGYAWLGADGAWVEAAEVKPDPKKSEKARAIVIDGKFRWTDQEPSAAASAKHLYVAHKTGSSGEQKLRLAVSTDGKAWTGTDQIKVGNKGLTSKYGPAIAMFGNSLVMVYVNPDDKKIWQAQYDNGVWSNHRKVTDFVVEYSPKLTAYGDKAALSIVNKGETKAVLYYLDVS